MGGTLGTVYLRNYRRRYNCSVSFSTTVYVLYYCEKEEKDVLERSLSIELISGARDVRMCGSAAAAAGRCIDGYMLRRLMTSRSVAPSDAKTKSIQPWQTIVVCTSNSHDLHSYSIPIISPFFFFFEIEEKSSITQQLERFRRFPFGCFCCFLYSDAR